MRYTFHQVTITTDCVSVVVNYVEFVFIVCCAQLSFSHRHTYSHCNTLTQWACSCINTCSMSEFRVTRSFASPLTELFQFFHWKIISAQVQQAVQQHGAMSCRQDKTVPVNPSWVVRVMSHRFCKKLVPHWSGAHRHTRVSGICLLNCINRQSTYGSNRQVVDCSVLVLLNRFVLVSHGLSSSCL